MEIRKSKARFISIFLIVALGVAFFSGIQAASPDMRFSGDAYYDSARLMDLKVIGTLGLTGEDVEAIKSIKGVQEAEGAYATDVMCGQAESQKVLHVESINEKVNQITATSGRLPEKRGECFLDSAFASASGYEVGDTITFRQEGETKLLTTETYQVVGTGSAPLYISFNRGNTTLGSGEVNGFVYVLPEDFDQEVYTQIYVKLHGAEELTSYTDGYDNLVEKMQERVEGIADARCEIRYEDVVGEAEEAIALAEEELADGKKEAEEKIADAEEELRDGEKELKKGKKEYEDGVKKLADAKEEIKNSQQEIADGKKKLEEGKQQLEDARVQLADGWAQLTPKKEELENGWSQLKSAQAQVTAGYQKLEAGKKELAAGEKKLEAAKKELTQKQKELDDAKVAIEQGKVQLEAARKDLTAKKQECENGLVQVEQGEAELAKGEAAFVQLQQQLEAQKAQYEQAVASGSYTEEELARMYAELAAFEAQVNQTGAELENNKAKLSEQRAQLEAALQEMETGFATLEAKSQELIKQEAQIGPGQAAIDEAKKTLKKEEAALAPARKEIEKNQKTLDDSQAQVDANRAVLSQGQAQVDAAEAKLYQAQEEITTNEQKISENEKTLKDGEQKLADGKQEIKENEKKLADARKEIEDGEKELKDGREELADAQKEAEEEIQEGEEKLADAKKELKEIKKPEWMVTDRNALPEYSDYGDNADRIRNIGKVFPVMFFLVAALISLTTMTRMVEEQRTQIGTMKALGYGKYDIASKYLNYAFLATVGGSACGVLIGEKILPYIIIKAYGIMYHNMASNLQIHYELKFALIASVAAVLCTIGATVFACYKELSETPASLMRPPAPKEGKRVLLERITFIWKHLNFTWKSCLRNLFRYKKRLFMTIFGIAGSMALMLVGFGIRDSIMDIAVLQYEELQHYDGTIIDDEDATEKEREELLEHLKKDSRISRYSPVQMTKMTTPNGNSSLSVYVYVPENLEEFQKEVTFRNRITKETYEMSDAGAVVSEKTASMLDLSIGDSITLIRDHKEYQVKIAVITENYMGHYIYMTEKIYQETFGEAPVYADIIFSIKEENQEQMEEIGKEILDYPAALSISYTNSIADQVERMLGSLEIVIVVLIISAGMLAFVVLYNLNNINITERQRELATLKVLGFYDMEVSQYVFRENVLLTILGIVAGAGMGILLHRYVIITVEVDAVMFGRNIQPISFLYCALFTIGFSAIVNLFMHRKLKKIDMVESLKSVE